MDSESSRIAVGVLSVLVFISTIILSLPTKYSVTISIVFCIVLSVVLAIILTILINWGGHFSNKQFLFFAIIFFIGSAGTSFFIRFIIYPFLKENELLKLKFLLLILLVIFLIYRYVVHFRQYIWKTSLLSYSETNMILIDVSINGLERLPDNYTNIFRRSIDVFSHHRLYKSVVASTLIDSKYKGPLTQLKLIYFVPKSQAFYKGEFNLPQKKIDKLMGNIYLYPLTKKQLYKRIDLLFNEYGGVSLQIANAGESIEVFNGNSTMVKKNDLSESELNLFDKKFKSRFKLDSHDLKKDSVLNSLKKSTGLEDNLKVLLENRFSIKHEISGLTKQIVSISAITANGERYTLHKKLWGGKSLPRLYYPPVTINIVVINNKGEYLNWDYKYDINNIASVLNENSELAKTNTPKEIRFTFALINNEENLLKATTFEYYYGKKYEIDITFKNSKSKYYNKE